MGEVRDFRSDIRFLFSDLFLSALQREGLRFLPLLSLVFFLSSAPALEISAQRRGASERVQLVHADRFTSDQYVNPGAQCLAGHVHFRQGIMQLKSDSAVFFETTNSFEAFGNVLLTQGDTLSLRGEYLYYDGESQMAEVRRKVVMRHRQQVLTTDSLNYDRLYNTGFFFEGGKLVDGQNVLTSDWGEYSTATRKASFRYNVKLTNPKYTLVSDTLHYDLQSKWSHVIGPSNIVSGETHIYTEDAFYNTDTEKTRMVKNTTMFSGSRTMSGDSLYYDKPTGRMEAYGNVYYEDKKDKHILTGEYGEYNEITGEAMATDSALARDYSQQDTLYVHADTLRLYTYNIKTDSVYRVLHGYFHVRAFRTDVQAVCDSLVFSSKTRMMTLFRDPIVWSDSQQVLGEEINVFMNDTTIDSIHVDRQALLAEQIDSLHYNQVAGRQMRSYFSDGEIVRNEVEGNVIIVYYPLEKDSTLLYHNYTETSLAKMTMKERKPKRIWTPAAQNCCYPVGMAPPERTFLENFAWFDYIRPVSKDDLFEWRRKRSGTELKATVRRQAPLPVLKR